MASAVTHCMPQGNIPESSASITLFTHLNPIHSLQMGLNASIFEEPIYGKLPRESGARKKKETNLILLESFEGRLVNLIDITYHHLASLETFPQPKVGEKPTFIYKVFFVV